MIGAAVHHHRIRRIEGYGACGVGGNRVTARVGGEHGEIDGFALDDGRLVEARQKQKVFDEHLHPRRLLLDAAQDDREVRVILVGVEPEQLGESLDRCERSAQLVRCVRQELTQTHLGRLAFTERLFDLTEHRVEGQTELTDLTATVGRLDALRQISGGDRSR